MDWKAALIETAWNIAYIVAIVLPLMLCVAYLTLWERKLIGWMQIRIGPNRVGPRGLLQPIADAVKLLLKEIIVPTNADRGLFILGPIMMIAPAVAAWAVVPFAPEVVLANVNAGLLYLLALTSMGVYGIALAGWSSNSKYSLLGSLRASAQMISYEIALGMSLIAVFLLTGNVTLSAVVAVQQRTVWFVLALMLGFVLFLISAFAETNRLPFDLPEAESELITGYHTEYSAMKFSMFFISEYAAMITMSALIATLFFGGWDIPFTHWDEGPPSLLRFLATLLAFGAKTGFFLVVYVWVRWTLPRFRFDQLMELGWKIMLPVALAYIMVIAVAVWLLERAGITTGTGYGLALFGVSLVATAAFLLGLDRGRLLAGSREQRRVVA